MQIMKDLKSQIKFIDKVMLPLFGIKSVCDYETIVYLDVIENTFDITQLNDILVKIKEIFPVKDFNFHKTHHTIISPKHAFNILKTCLNIALIPHSVDYKNKRKYLRLFSSNITLHNYIMQLQAETSDIRPFEPSQSNYTPNYMHYHDGLVHKSTYDEMLDNIKKETVVEFIFNLDMIYNKEHNEIRIDIKSLMIESAAIKNIKIDICSTKLRNSDILARDFVQDLFKTSRVKLLNNTDHNSGDYFPLLFNTPIINESFVFPLGLITHTTLILAIDNVFNASKITNLLELKLSMSTIEFYSDFNKRLPLPITIPIVVRDMNTSIMVTSGMWDFSTYRPSRNRIIPTDRFKDETHGSEITLYQINGFKLDTKFTHSNMMYNAIQLICNSTNPYNFITFRSQINIDNHKYWVKKSECTYEHCYVFYTETHPDTISNISIVGQLLEQIDVDQYIISFSYKSLSNVLETTNCCIEKFSTDLVALSSTNNHYVCRCSDYNPLCLVVTTNSTTKPISIINVEYDNYVWNNSYRTKFVENGNVMVDLSTLI